MSQMPYALARFRIVGDRGLLVEYGNGISPQINRKVRSMNEAVSRRPPEGILEAVPNYRSILIRYDPLVTNPERLKDELNALQSHLKEIEIPPPRVTEIPVCYGGEYGPDIEFVASRNGISVEEVIKLHSEPKYLIYMIGFSPGFPFLGGLNENLHTPRLKTPRTMVPAGTVGIANNQTGIYPVASPGGWQLIGRTPLKLFDPDKPNPFLLEAGNMLRFKPVSHDRFEDLQKVGSR